MEKGIFPIEVKEKRADGGRIVINTGSVDRDRDRVKPSGANIANYMKNPVVQWGHNYFDPWATVGKTTELTIFPDRIEAEFELRPAANDADPQNVVRLLWDGGWIKTASIGFNPLEFEKNEMEGHDFTSWDLLEWSLVPIPANQDALRLASKALDATAEPPAPVVEPEAPPEPEPEPVAAIEPTEPTNDSPAPDDDGDEMSPELALVLSNIISAVSSLVEDLHENE